MQTSHPRQVQPSKIYSAKEAFFYVSKKHPTIVKESDFREILRKDISGENVFNAKMYVKGSQPRFIISGIDLANGLKKFVLRQS